MEQLDIDALLKKFDMGLTTLEEEEQIKTWLAIHGDAEPYRVYHNLFRDLEKAEQHLKTATENQLIPIDFEKESTRIKKVRQISSHWMQIAAGFLLLIIGLGGGWFLNQNDTTQVADLQAEIIEIKQLLLKSQVEPLAASYRMDLVEQIIEQPTINPTLLNTLNNIISQDENINVRISAIQGLANYAQQEEVQTILIQALTTQKDANIQMLLIGILTQYKVKKAKPQLEKLINNEAVFDFVKTQAKQTLKSL